MSKSPRQYVRGGCKPRHAACRSGTLSHPHNSASQAGRGEQIPACGCVPDKGLCVLPRAPFSLSLILIGLEVLEDKRDLGAAWWAELRNGKLIALLGSNTVEGKEKEWLWAALSRSRRYCSKAEAGYLTERQR